MADLPKYKYRVLQDSVIGSGLVKAGEIIEYDGVSEGKPGANLELLPGQKLAATKRAAKATNGLAAADETGGAEIAGGEVTAA
ncbi:MAG: hypothetical protein ABSB19_17330 [Methylomonas sp.]|jgi:hypothetical protein